MAAADGIVVRGPSASTEIPRLLLIGTGVAAAYLMAARLGFVVAFAAEQVTTVWAPTGIAQAALLLWGRRLWPAVWLGAFAANAGTEAPLWTAVCIATGNTLEAVAMAWILRRDPAFDPRLGRFADAARFIVVGAILATTISASVGVTTLCLAAVQPWSRFADLWSAWWFGDALGALVVAPVIVTTVHSVGERSLQHWRRVGVLVLGSMATAEAVFGQLLGPPLGMGPLHYVVFPFVIVAAVGFGQPATAMVVLGGSVVTIWHTVLGEGPFATPDVHQGLVLLQLFMGILASTGLLLAAAMTERQTSHRHRAASHDVRRVLADAPDLERAAPAILQSICENLGWQGGALWLADHEDLQLRCLTVWSSPATAPADSLRTTQETSFRSGIGRPARVWETGRAVIEDVQEDRTCPRSSAAQNGGVRGAVAFPIVLGGDALGVVEFFTRRVATPDPELLETMSTVGHQIGQFIGRKRVEAARVQADETVRVSEERFRRLAAINSALTLYEQDRELRYRWVYPQHPEFPHQNIGKTDRELLPPGEGERLWDMKQAVLRTGVGRREEITVSLPGETRSYDLMVEPRRDLGGAIVGVSGVAVDITERKRSEQLLVEHKNVLELIVTGHSMGACLAAVAGAASRLSAHARGCVLVADAAGRTIVASHAVEIPPSFVHEFGNPSMHAEAATDRILRNEATLFPDIERDDRWPAAWRELCLSHGIRACHFEPAVGADGIAVGWFMLCLDEARAPSASERRAAEFAAHIASIVIERHRAEGTLRASEERLREADRRKDEFLAMLAHELRNPLAPIRTGLELVRLAGDTPEAVERIRPMMERQVGHMVRLIDDLLDVSRITSGKIHLQKQPAPLADLVEGAVEANRAGLQAAGLELTVRLPESLPLLFVDRTRFVQVLSNLLNNAAQFTDAGGRIVISAHIVSAAPEPDELVLSVLDTGVGISSEMLPRVFDLFTQGERSARRPQAGLGIGLALARRIVEMHGGRIEARSGGPGRGSEFTIHLPVVEAVGTGSEGDERSRVPRPAVRRRVLVVDDNADAAETLASLVRALGGEARTAADGPSGIECASKFSPDVILLDIGMPAMDGYETCRRIRQEAFGERAIIVAITGWGQETDKRRAAQAGFDAHLTKPADPVTLERLLAAPPADRRARRSKAGDRRPPGARGRNMNGQ